MRCRQAQKFCPAVHVVRVVLFDFCFFFGTWLEERSERWHASVDSSARARAKTFVDTHTPRFSLCPKNPIAFQRQRRMTRAFFRAIQNERERDEKRREGREAQTSRSSIDRRLSYPASIRFPRSPGTPLRSRPLNRLSRIPSTRRAAPIPIGGRRGRPRHASGASANRWRRASRRRNLSARGSLEES